VEGTLEEQKSIIMEPWSTDYARSLSLDQWPDQIHARFVEDFANRIDSMPFRNPIKSELARFGVVELSWPVLVDWDINSISFRDDSTLFIFSGYFFVEVPSWYPLPSGESAPEPLSENDNGNPVILIGFDGTLSLDNSGVISTSEVSRVYTDLEMMPD